MSRPVLLAAVLLAGTIGATAAHATAGEKVDKAVSAASAAVVKAQKAVVRGAKAAASGVERGAQAAGRAADKAAKKVGVPGAGASAPAK